MDTEPRLLTETGIPDAPRQGPSYMPEVGAGGALVLGVLWMVLRFLERQRGLRDGGYVSIPAPSPAVPASTTNGSRGRPNGWTAQEALLHSLNENVVKMTAALTANDERQGERHQDLKESFDGLATEIRGLGNYIREKGGAV